MILKQFSASIVYLHSSAATCSCDLNVDQKPVSAKTNK